MARVDVLIPRRGIEDSAEEVEIQEWYVKEGDIVEKGKVIFLFNTGKAELEIEALVSGRVGSIQVGVGVKIPAKKLTLDGNYLSIVVAIIETEVDEVVSVPQLIIEKEETIVPQEKISQIQKQKVKRLAWVPEEIQVSTHEDEPRAVYAARTMAVEKGVDLSFIKGTGPDGIITADDVLKEVELKGSCITELSADSDFEAASVVRKTIATNLTLGHLIPTAAGEKFVLNMGDLLTFKKWHSKRFEDIYSVPYTIMFPMCCAVVRVLERPVFRRLNARAVSIVRNVVPGIPCLEYRGMRYQTNINLGLSFNDGADESSNLKIAVAKSLQGKSLKEIAVVLDIAMREALNGKSEFLSGWTFLLNNIGGIGDDTGQSILAGVNFDPCTGTIENVVSELNVGAIDRETGKATIQIFFDHRPFDGKLASSFRNAVHKELVDGILPELAKSLY